MNKIDKYIVFSITVIILYTVAALVLTWFGREVPGELTVAFFAAFAGETVNCMMIKRFKLKKGE